MAGYGILFDQSLCIGCKACEQACQAEHDQPPHVASRLDEQSFNWVREAGRGAFTRRFCMHCLDPTCVSVCPVAALQKTADGPVIYLPQRCMGCRYCMMACPFGIPKYEWHSVNPRVRKCDMCVHRVSKGRETACASICPTGATIFGRRDALVEEAHRRIKAAPSTYAGGLYGEREAGGTAVLLLLAVSRGESGLPSAVPEDPLPKLTWSVLEKLPRIIPVWAVFLGGLYWLTLRKREVARAERDSDHGGESHG